MRPQDDPLWHDFKALSPPHSEDFLAMLEPRPPVRRLRTGPRVALRYVTLGLVFTLLLILAFLAIVPSAVHP